MRAVLKTHTHVDAGKVPALPFSSAISDRYGCEPRFIAFPWQHMSLAQVPHFQITQFVEFFRPQWGS